MISGLRFEKLEIVPFRGKINALHTSYMMGNIVYFGVALSLWKNK